MGQLETLYLEAKSSFFYAGALKTGVFPALQCIFTFRGNVRRVIPYSKPALAPRMVLANG